MEREPFAPTLTASQSYKLGEPILVTLEIKNQANEAYQVLTAGTPLDGQLTADSFIVERDGERLEYDGKLVKRGDPSSESYVVVKPGKSIKETVDLSTAYSLDTPGIYTVTVNATVLDAFPVPGNAKQAPRKRADHERLQLTGASVQFEIEDGGTPKLTAGQAARAASAKKLEKSSAKAPNFDGGTTSERDATVIAHANAQYFAALAAAQLEAGPDSTNALYQTWFGSFDQGRYDKVTKDYNDISNTLLTEQVTYDLSGDGCDPGVFAYTHKGDRTVWLCSLYKSAAQIGTDCKFGTLIHEWSHAVSSTDDNVYGESGCQTLATSDPGKATNNADSHEYFAEHNAQSDFGKTFTFITDRSTFGQDEIKAMLAKASSAVIEKAFYVLADGFWPAKLGITAGSLGTSPNVKPTIAVSPPVSGMQIKLTSLEAEDTTLPEAPQRFTWVFEIVFTDDSGFPTTPGGVTPVTLTATLGGLTSSAQIQLIHEPNPYELDGPTSWLSTDVRVFQIRANERRFGATMGTSGADAPTYIKQVIANLNTPGASEGQTFDDISTDQQTSALELAQSANGTRVFNFAIAKVRYRGTTDISDVRVFFRLFPASTTSTNFDPATTYRRSVQGTTTIPLLGVSGGGNLLTIPCFAEARINSASASMTSQQDPTNVRTIKSAGADEALAFFGCWLDINQTPAQFPANPSPSDGPWASGRKSVQELIRNAHQCLVAEIAFDPDPVPGGVSPAASDKLAQRNLAIVESPNPGADDSRRIMTTFDLQPVAGKASATPDELLIEWGNTPVGSNATIFIPEIDAAQIVELASSRFANNPIRQIDGQTIGLSVGGISYVPLPAATAFGLTGLLSVELSDEVRKGDVYTVIVRQVSDIAALVEEPPPVIDLRKGHQAHESPELLALMEAGASTSGQRDVLRWRRIVGSYQLTIPVRTKQAILPRETRLLSVLRWILNAVPTEDRWYPVFSRYVGLVGDRVRGLGGDPDAVEPSPDGVTPGRGREDNGPSRPHAHHAPHTHRGKVAGLIYDCFGDFEGFILDDCGTEVVFEAREREIEKLVRNAWRKRIAITVVATEDHPRRPRSIILRRGTKHFHD